MRTVSIHKFVVLNVSQIIVVLMKYGMGVKISAIVYLIIEEMG